MQLLAEGLEGLAPAGDPVCEALAKLAGLVAQWAPRMNLTAHRTAESVARRLILDAVALDAALPAGVDSLVDVGSGAGFPGLPLAILHPERRIVLIEARERRHHFQRMAIRALGLTNVEARHGRAESLSPSLHDVGIAQAAATPAEAVLLLLPWVRPGGWLVIPGGKNAPKVGRRPEIESAETRHYQVPLGGPLRSVWLGRKRQ